MRSLCSSRSRPAVAFTPAVAPRKIVRGGRRLRPGFPQGLGFEKPQAAPDFGGSDDKPAEEPKAEEEAEEKEEAEAASGRGMDGCEIRAPNPTTCRPAARRPPEPARWAAAFEALRVEARVGRLGAS